MSTGFQVTPEFDVVVNLAVENDVDGFILVGDWLVSALDVDDAEPAAGEPRAELRQREIAGVVRPAVNDGVSHLLEDIRIAVFRDTAFKDACDSTHRDRFGVYVSNWKASV